MPKKQQQLLLQKQRQAHLNHAGTTSATTNPKYSLTLLNVKSGGGGGGVSADGNNAGQHYQQHNNNNNSSSINNNNNYNINMSQSSGSNCQLHPHRKSPHPHLQPQYAFYQQQQQQQTLSKREKQKQQLSQSYYHPPPAPRHQLRVLRLSSAPTGVPEPTTKTTTIANGTTRRENGDRSSGEFSQRNSTHIEQSLRLSPAPSAITAAKEATQKAIENPLVDTSSDCDVNISETTAATTAKSTSVLTPTEDAPTAGATSKRGTQQQQLHELELQQQKANRLWYH